MFSMLRVVTFAVVVTFAHCFIPVFITTPEASVRKISNVSSQFIQSICGRSSPIVFGNGTMQNYPWAVSITSKGKNKLGGAIISNFHILTAAHPFLKSIGYDNSPCVNSRYRTFREVRELSVHYGGRCIRGKDAALPNHPSCEYPDVQTNKIAAVVIDGEFFLRGCTEGHDWAIIELERPMPFSNRIAPICLPYENQGIHRLLTIFGWGRTNTFFESSPLLRETRMAHNEECDAPWSDIMPTKVDDYLCTKAIRPTDLDAPRTCYGDSGSGMEQRDENGIATLVGITSFGTKGCPSNELARFTRVDRYLRPICWMTGVCYTL